MFLYMTQRDTYITKKTSYCRLGSFRRKKKEKAKNDDDDEEEENN